MNARLSPPERRLFERTRCPHFTLVVVDEIGGTVEKVYFSDWPPALQSPTPHSGN